MVWRGSINSIKIFKPFSGGKSWILILRMILTDASRLSKHSSRLSTPPTWHQLTPVTPVSKLQTTMVPHHEKSIRTAQRTWQWASGVNLHSNCAKSLKGGKVKTLFTLWKAVNVAPVELFRSCRRLYRDARLHFLTQNLNDGVSMIVVLYWCGRVCCFASLRDSLVVKCKNCKQSRQINTFFVCICSISATSQLHTFLFSYMKLHHIPHQAYKPLHAKRDLNLDKSFITYVSVFFPPVSIISIMDECDHLINLIVLSVL